MSTGVDAHLHRPSNGRLVRIFRSSLDVSTVALGVAFSLIAACEPAPGEPPSAECNGAESLCAKRFDEVAYACTHNAMSNSEEGWKIPNQNRSMRRQLDDGVRALMLDLHLFEDVPHLCHGVCGLGLKPLVQGLLEIRKFIEDEPREVVSLLLESYVTSTVVEAAFEEAGLLPYLHSQEYGAPWPTLGEMIDSGRRLVVFTQDDGGPSNWHHALYAFASETHYAFESPEEMDCSPHRGSAKNGLFLVNHFITRPFADPAFAEVVNRNPFFGDRVQRCREERGQFPNFIAVDFHDIGDLMQVVDGLNGVGQVATK